MFSFYLFSQGLAPVCKHPTAFAQRPALASNCTHLPLEKPALGRAPSWIAGRTAHAPGTFPRASEALWEINLSPSEHSSVAQKWPGNRKERNGLPAKAGNSTQGGAVCRGFPVPIDPARSEGHAATGSAKSRRRTKQQPQDLELSCKGGNRPHVEKALVGRSNVGKPNTLLHCCYTHFTDVKTKSQRG